MKLTYKSISTAALILGFISLIVFSFLFWIQSFPFDFLPPLDTNRLDHFGSLIGGVVGALFSLASILLLIHTIKEQDLDRHRSKVESRFFELVKIHLANRNEIQAGDKSGKYAIQRMVKEARICIEAAKKLNIEMQTGYDDLKIISFGYLAFYFGSAMTDEKVNKSFRLYTKDYKKEFVDAFVKWSNDEREVIKLDRNFTYRLFSGHQIRLSQYFRQLYQTVIYIDKQESNIISYEIKYEYIKTLRAQLSPHEQLLLLYNSLTILGYEWEKKYNSNPNRQLITKYNLVKNILANNFTNALFQYFPCVEYESQHLPECRQALKKHYT